MTTGPIFTAARRAVAPALAAAWLAAAAPALSQLIPDAGLHLHENSPGVPSSSQSSEYLGHALAVGDFDGDGLQDLAVGVPGETVGGQSQAGAVIVAYGTPSGLDGAPMEIWSVSSFSGLGLVVQAGAFFGYSLAVGDFNDDDYDDLAIGAPLADYRRADGVPRPDSGALFVLQGSAGGLSTTNQKFFVQGLGGLADDLDAGDLFGWSLAAGDFNGSGFDDLAIGVPGEDVAGHDNAGAVNALYGTVSGLSGFAWGGDPLWTQGNFGFASAAGDQFGARLAAGDFDADGDDDLAIGIPGREISGHPDAGRVLVVQAVQFDGLVAAGSFALSQASAQIPGAPGDGDAFGYSLAVGDVDGDGVDDLAIGSPGEGLINPDGGGISNVGIVHVLRGEEGAGLSGGGVAIRIDRTDLGAPAGFERFGHAVALADFDGDGGDDLVVGAPGIDEFGIDEAGLAFVFTAPAHHAWSALTTLGQLGGAPGAPGVGDQLGRSLAPGDFNGDGHPELAVGIPYDDGPSAMAESGAVNVYLNALIFRDDFEGGSTSAWSE